MSQVGGVLGGDLSGLGIGNYLFAVALDCENNPANSVAARHGQPWGGCPCIFALVSGVFLEPVEFFSYFDFAVPGIFGEVVAFAGED
jgi:hypothetical protein